MFRCAFARTNSRFAMVVVPPHLAERKAGQRYAGSHPPPRVLLVLGEGQRSARRAHTAAGPRRRTPAGRAGRMANMAITVRPNAAAANGISATDLPATVRPSFRLSWSGTTEGLATRHGCWRPRSAATGRYG